ncbi:plasmid mobilization relaxosome protein MobC [Nocardia higoensis]|uniref:Plasmid mobilization relaxosome protein MobC n=1 Tax=Nocardia higoensis TaxID=228599 RepID=A0ABS0DII7_9NOCA|nr:MobC family plasmid mobilization relaxosome protein [Nocardia higoensis]MBF6358234.1 plasmid mobilization relaxosome protein MobC [Nocardia higoensis]
MAGESPDRRARVRRERQANVPGGRPHRHIVKLSDAEHEDLTRRALEAGVSVPRLLVESATDSGRAEAGRAHAALQLLEFDDQIRRIGNNLNQLVRWAHQNREIPEHLIDSLHAVTRACLSVDATARWVMGLDPAVTGVSVDVEADLPISEEWAGSVDPDEIDGV